MLRVGGDGGERLGRGPEQEVVDGGLVLESNGADRSRQGEDDMIIGERQEFRLAFGEPLPRRGTLAFRSVAVAAGIVGDAHMGAVLAALDVSAERRGPTGLDRRHHFQLGEADVTGVGLAPRRPMGAKEAGPTHMTAVEASSWPKPRVVVSLYGDRMKRGSRGAPGGGDRSPQPTRLPQMAGGAWRPSSVKGDRGALPMHELERRFPANARLHPPQRRS